MEQKPPTFEGALEQLQQIVRKLEGGELSLEQALQFFEEGVKLTRLCQDQLSAAEKRIEVLTRVANDKAEVQPFNPNKA